MLVTANIVGANEGKLIYVVRMRIVCSAFFVTSLQQTV